MAREQIGGEILKGHIATMVLSVIASKPLHGYEIMKILSRRSSGVFELGQGTVYPLLYALEEQGLVKSADEVVAGRRRRLYSLTASGRRQLADKKRTWRAFVAAVNAVIEPARMGATCDGHV